MNWLRVVGMIWVLPVALPIWLFYVLPAWALGWLQFAGSDRFGVTTFLVNDELDNWHSRRWKNFSGLALPYGIFLNVPSIRVTLHELRHTDQWLLFGCLFPVVYGGLLLTHGYRSHPLEADARRAETRLV